MPEMPNSVVTHFDTKDTRTKSAANSAAGPSSSGFPPDGGSVDCCDLDSSGAGRENRYCSAQNNKPASERPQSGSASSRASVKLKNATTNKMRRYMRAV